MKKLRNLILTGCVLALTACGNFDTHSEVEALNEAQAVGSPFTQYLADEYRTFSNRELNDMLDYPDALHFARKGLATAAGEVVMPEPISDWNLLPEHIEELSAARGRLVIAFDLGAREMYPRESAIAQSRFDCWIEQQEENWQDTDIQGCKLEFLEAMTALEAMLQPMMPPPAEMVPPPMETPITMPEEVEPMMPEEAMFIVFFDFDSSTINEDGQNIMDSVAAEIAKRGPALVQIVGHTDSSGPKTYNEKLAMRRANAVKDALTGRGVDASTVKVEGRGENELLVQTADNVREPANRRAQITFE